MDNPLLSPDQLNTILESFDQPVAVLSDSYRILATNQAYLEHYQQAPSPVGRNCYEVSHGYDRPCDQAGESCPLLNCRSSGLRQRVLHLHNTCHGREHVDVEMLPLPQQPGKPRLYLEIMHKVRVAETHAEGSGLVGTSAAFNRMLELIQRAAPSEISVLLLGQSGSGKELVAKALHQASRRSDKPFVTVECSGLSESLFESEMFGHERGAFTGAVSRKTGLVSEAQGGTLFLDEVGDIPPTLQVKLLRLIETGTYRAAGGVDLKQADFRLICATHHNLRQKVEQGLFRQDLFYRISSFPVELPSLQQRLEDLPLLVEALLKRIKGGEHYQLTPAALDRLRRYAFPGNIRELRNFLERGVLLSDSGWIGPEHLPDEVGGIQSQQVNPLLPQTLIPLDQLETAYLQQIRKQFSGSNRELADQLGVSERTLYRKLRQLS
ncbi:sigma-54 interaction domain-containing protein [Neptuniibacter halophilus]|uniref:sigma-54 interaction domain-containing protein n=1 Tax=Neptuniibacter halophilus TaxID=651666 RepID=UPI0025724AB8|nr:sigma-54-dependent Fis family transcriptional regulator [Neptuniibacter halophilus]